jgi:type III secretory pathway component EscT
MGCCVTIIDFGENLGFVVLNPLSKRSAKKTFRSKDTSIMTTSYGNVWILHFLQTGTKSDVVDALKKSYRSFDGVVFF